jgi:sugar lactone lactonase YvrE
MPSDIGAFAQVTAAAVVALRNGIFRLGFADDSRTLLAPRPFDPNLFRFNEGVRDAAGLFWVGVMSDPLEQDHRPQRSSLHRFDLASGLSARPDASELRNGMAWSPDGMRFYLAHTKRGDIFAFDYDPALGRLGERRLFASVPESDGVPGAAAVDDCGAKFAIRGFTGAPRSEIIHEKLDIHVTMVDPPRSTRRSSIGR